MSTDELKNEFIVLKGEKGDIGPQGPVGPQGPQGTTDYNDLINKPDLSNFITNTVDDLVNYYKKNETYNQNEINQLINNVTKVTIQVVNTLPKSPETNVIYFVPKESKTSNVYDEYIYVDNEWELIGTTAVDLTNYVTNDALNTALANYTTTLDLTTLLSNKQDIMQFSTMPTASADNLGKIVQFVGTTTNDYTNGYFYKCVVDNNVYSWANIDIQDASGGEEILELTGSIWRFPSTQSISFTFDTNSLNLLKSKIDEYIADSSKNYFRGHIYGVADNNVYNYIVAIKINGGNNIYNVYFSVLEDKEHAVQDPKTMWVTQENQRIYYYNSWRSQSIYFYQLSRVCDYDTLVTQWVCPRVLTTGNTKSYTPTGDYHPATKKYVDDKLTSISGYDATKTQVLKNVNGTLTWVDEA